MTSQKTTFFPEPETGRLSEENAKRYFSTLGFAVFLMSVVTFAVSNLLAYAVYFDLPSLYESYLFAPILSVFSIYACGLPALLAVLRRLPKVRPVKEKKSVGFTLGAFCACFALVIAGNSVSQMIMTMIETALGSEVANPVDTSLSSTPIWVNLLFTVILAPILEELVFRKILCDRLLPLGEGYAVFLSASIFALFHGNFYQLFYAFLLGACFGYIYVKTGKLGYSVIYHIAINFLCGVLPAFLSSLLDVEKLNELMEGMASADEEWVNQVMVFFRENLFPLMGTLGLSAVQTALSVVGAVLLILFMARKNFSLEEGILPPPKEARISPIFMNFGVALAIAAFAIELILSLL